MAANRQKKQFHSNDSVLKISGEMDNPDIRSVEEIMDYAQNENEDLPDSEIGIVEMHEYGYLKDDMYPLRKGKALNLHQMGEKIYCLQPDGTHGEYASREMILDHDGIYGIEKEAWDRMKERDDVLDDFSGEYLYQPMSIIDRDEALHYFDAGMTIYLITTNLNPVAVTERMEIERGADTFQIERDELAKARHFESQIQNFPQIDTLKEARLLLGSESRFGIYQIDHDSKGREYSFMGMDFIEQHGIEIEKSDYQLVYSDNLYPVDTLDSLYERFNINRPKDFTGHSMSVSDVIVIYKEREIKAYFVDSFGFRELPDFIEKEQFKEERVYRLEDNENGYKYLAIHERDEGYDYTFYNSDYMDIDGGIYDNPDISLDEALCDIISDENVRLGELLPDYDSFMEEVEEAEDIFRAEVEMSGEDPLYEEEIGVLYKIAEETGMDTWFHISEDAATIEDLEEKQVISLHDGIQDLYEGIPSYIDCNMNERDIHVFENLLRRLEIPIDTIPITSGLTEPDHKLNGQSKDSIESSVLAIALAEIAEENLDARVLAVRVYGSRTREHLYRDDSDIDVVVVYEGEIREDDFSQMLNASGYAIDGMKLDINPIKTDKTGSLEYFLNQNEKYLDEKAKEYKPLAKVEELEEANYNMIDNVINNERPKKWLDYYVAECEEFHDMGAFYDGLTLREATEKYRKIVADPLKSYLGNALGFVLHDSELPDYSENPWPLVQGKVICGDNLDDVNVYLVHPLVKEAMEEMRKAFPDYYYRPSKDIQEAYYPEKMSLEELVTAIDEMVCDFDTYDYRDREKDRKIATDEIRYALLLGEKGEYVTFLKDVIEDEGELSSRAEVLLRRLRNFQPELHKDMEPIVKIVSSDYPELTSQRYVPLKQLDNKIVKLNQELSAVADASVDKGERKYHLQYQIYYSENGKLDVLEGKMNIGAGDGGLIEKLKAQTEMRLTDDDWNAYKKGQGGQAYEEYIAEMTDMQERILPYLQSFCSMQEHDQINDMTIHRAGQLSDAKEHVEAVKSVKIETGKLSIHERLEQNKEKLSKQLGKDLEKKGVELM